MTRLEWWYTIDPGFVAFRELLNVTFPTIVSGYDATVHLPSVHADWVDGSRSLAPPQIDGRPQERPSEDWGMVHSWTHAGVVSVVIRRFALTTDLPGDEDARQAAESIVAAMDKWWDNVRSWIEISTGQPLTQVGHREVLVIGEKTPIWQLNANGTHGDLISIPGRTFLRLPGSVEDVSTAVLSSCTALAGTTPEFAWRLLMDARALQHVGHYRRAVIDAATSAELAVSAILEDRLAQTEESVRDALLAANRMLGPKRKLLRSLNCRPLPPRFENDLVDPRNRAVHKGDKIDRQTCGKAISVAAQVVEEAYPLPTPPGADPLRRLWL